MQEHATALAEALERALPEWVERVAPGVDPSPVVDPTMREVRRLLSQDIDDQRSTPLAIVRELAVPLLTRELAALGAPPVARDDFAREQFPDDVYALTPSSWADIDEALVEPGITWGAAKAWTHKQRHAT